MAEEDAAAPESKRTGRRTKKAVPEEASAPPQALPSSADVKKAKKADLIAWAKTLGLETVGKVDELRSRILSALGTRGGGQPKLRRHLGSRPPVPSIGYRGPRAARGLHPSGFAEVIVHTLRDLTRIDSKRQAVRIAATGGDRKREMIQKQADELGIRVLNRR